jgi:hypothetical protein
LDWMPFSTPECLILLMPWSAWFHLKWHIYTHATSSYSRDRWLELFVRGRDTREVRKPRCTVEEHGSVMLLTALCGLRVPARMTVTLPAANLCRVGNFYLRKCSLQLQKVINNKITAMICFFTFGRKLNYLNP